ncbi:SAC3/GANP/Nin1/mts3/eIF-3 p25 family-domain-containing protein [Apodospora peruviana]|uniref:SAC3/GANP/Nin1/mts3/eIF-3 p25 family-domain-containing protein n=1 Tax=Apodospora peruviana TaxID=516989 RepID=A0AAE0IJT8_9PEZI|nr:SAC3/GANP/Nin1/mts3/eIF-3 p25 family-domain-containing protein [Apodospora peruviana]
MAQPINNPFGTATPAAMANPFGTTTTSQPVANPFGSTTATSNNPFGAAPANSPFGAISAASNPFGVPIQNASRPPSAGNNNPFGAPSTATSVFGTPANSAPNSRVPSPGNALQNPFGNPTPASATQSPFGNLAPSNPVQNTFGQPSASSAAQSPFGNPAALGSSSTFPSSAPSTHGAFQKPSTFGTQPPPNGPLKESTGFGAAGFDATRRSKSPAPINGFGGQNGAQPSVFGEAKGPARQNNQGAELAKKFDSGQKKKQIERPDGKRNQAPFKKRTYAAPTREPSQRTKELSPFAFDFANKLYSHLEKQNIKPPQWPPEPGNPNRRGAVDALKESYKKYRTKVYSTLRKAELIDDPEKRRRLEDALPFKGICEDMCPEFEQISRIAEFDIKNEEKETRPDLTMWPDVSRMVKKFGRSAAGQDAPLPMDVRSVDALRRTIDYLFNDLLQSDNNLPSMHNFLWDRTRAVRKDFTFHSQKSKEEMKAMVFVFETLTRFHATSFHLLSRKGFANEDFDQKQEIEQLGRTILSLIEAYDLCREKGVHCENEPEFRAYYLLLNAHDSSIAKRIPQWGKEYWFESKEIQTAMSLMQVLDDLREPKGPIKPRRPTSLSDVGFMNYFQIVEDPRVSYTMACVAAVHFTFVRQNILRNLVRGYARHRDAPRTISVSDLNEMLRFDTNEEAKEFIELHGFEFSSWAPDGKAAPPEPYLLLNNKKKYVPSPRVPHSYSGQMIERKRGAQSLPNVIFNTIYEEPEEIQQNNSPDDLFVTQSRIVEAPAKAAAEELVSSPTPTAASFSVKDTRPANGVISAPQASASPFLAKHSPALGQTTTSSPFSQTTQPPTHTPSPQLGSPQPAATASTTGPSTLSFSILKPSATPNPLFPPAESPASQPTNTASQDTPKPATNKDVSSKDASAVKPTFPAMPAAPASILSSTPKNDPSTSWGNFFPGVKPQSSTSTGAAATHDPTPAVPSIKVTPPSITGTPKLSAQPQPAPTTTPIATPPAAQQPLPSASGSVLPSGIFAPPQLTGGTSQATLTQQPPTKVDLMGDFTKWFVQGDGGLLEEFTRATVQDLVSEVFTNWEASEAERIRKEEDDRSWEEARKFQNYNLRVKYFYRWQENARALARKRILRAGKEKMRLHREHERAEAKRKREKMAKAAAAERKAARRRLEEDGRRLSQMAMSERRPSMEEQLPLASGIFSGLRDERGAARRVVRDVANAGPWGSSYAESELELEPPRRSLMAPRQPAQSPDSTTTDKLEGGKTRTLREKFGLEPRRSLSASSSINGSSSRFRQSLPASTTRTTNFSRKRSADESSDGEQDPKRKSVNQTSGFKSRHWDLRARGFVPMPNGDWLPEAIAKPMKKGKSISGYTSFAASHQQSPSGGSIFSSPSPPAATSRKEGSPKRKRNAADDDDDMSDVGYERSTKKSHIGRAETSAMVEDVQRMIRELNETMDQLDQDRPLMHEQVELSMLGNPG